MFIKKTPLCQIDTETLIDAVPLCLKNVKHFSPLF